jgi:hypothetical protein
VQIKQDFLQLIRFIPKKLNSFMENNMLIKFNAFYNKHLLENTSSLVFSFQYMHLLNQPFLQNRIITFTNDYFLYLRI